MMLCSLATLMLISAAYAVQWPKGTYTLVKPKVGCPPGWKQGWRRQDNEDSNNKNFITWGHHFYGSFGKNMKFYYCTKDDHTLPTTGYWPRGNYCILRSTSSCPPGFQTGYIRWDDEDRNNKNSKWGVLPSGTFNENTLIYYCCRSDGAASTPIELPRSKPFYLLRYKAPCQRVTGMLVREEIVKTDDEDKNNNNRKGGSHPLNDGGRNNRLYYCYYY